MMEEQVADDVDDLHFVSAPVSEESYLVAFTRKAQMTSWIEALPGSEELKRFSPEALCSAHSRGRVLHCYQWR